MLVLLTYNTHTHLFILMTVMKENIDSTASRQVWSRRRRSWIQWSWSSCWSRFRKLSSNCEDFPKISVDGKLNYDAMIVTVHIPHIYIHIYIHIHICVIHLKIGLHILMNDDDLNVNWVWVCCKNIGTYPGCCSTPKGLPGVNTWLKKIGIWYHEIASKMGCQPGCHSWSITAMYLYFMKLLWTSGIPFLLQKPR